MKNKLKLGFNTKHYTIVYEKNTILSNLSTEHKDLVTQYIKDYPLSKDGSIWLDEKNNKCFSRYQYRKTNAGKDAHFNIAVDSIEKGVRWSKSYYQYIIEKFKFGDLKDYKILGSELVFSTHEKSVNNDGKSVLIVCGGPSVNEVSWEKMSFDQIWSCNEFYKNKKLKNKNVDLAAIVEGVFDYNNTAEFTSLMEQNKTIACFELERGNIIEHKPSYEKVRKFYKKYPQNTAFFATRYNSALGIGPRLITYAAFMGFKDIYIVGLDGRSKVEENGNLLHAFDGNKDIPNWYKKHGDDFQERQMIIFWEYLLELSEALNFDFYNLGEGAEFNVLTDLFYNHYPLPSKIKETIR